MKPIRALPLAVLLAASLALQAFSQTSSNAAFKVSAAREGAVYKKGETVTFKVTRPDGSKVPSDAVLTWKVSKDGVAPVQTGTLKLNNGAGVITARLDEPGHLLCGVTATNTTPAVTIFAGAAIDPLLIKPSMPVPDDFDAFWKEQKAKLAAVPMNVRMQPVTITATNLECFDVQADCVGDAPTSGYYVRPAGAKPKSLPIILMLHGAGVYTASTWGPREWAERGFIAMDINAHGLPNGKPAEYYKETESKSIRGYSIRGRESREECYFLGMFLRALRAVDFLTAQPEWDGKTIVVYGSSQGAFQSFAVAALEPRVSFIAAGVPAGCDHTGVVVGRVNGWPKFVPSNSDGKPDEKIVQAVRYFDVVNFAARTHAKAAFVTVGFIDQTCPPTTVYAAYNALPITKEIFNDIPTAHANSPEAMKARNQAVMDFVKSVK